MPARATGDRRVLSHASKPRMRRGCHVHATGVVHDPTACMGPLAALHLAWLPEVCWLAALHLAWLPEVCWRGHARIPGHSDHRLGCPGNGQLDLTRAGPALDHVHRPYRGHCACSSAFSAACVGHCACSSAFRAACGGRAAFVGHRACSSAFRAACGGHCACSSAFCAACGGHFHCRFVRFRRLGMCFRSRFVRFRRLGKSFHSRPVHLRRLGM